VCKTARRGNDTKLGGDNCHSQTSGNAESKIDLPMGRGEKQQSEAHVLVNPQTRDWMHTPHSKKMFMGFIRNVGKKKRGGRWDTNGLSRN